MRNSRHSMASKPPGHRLLTGVAAGLVAGVVTGVTDRILDHLVSEEQKRRDKMVREAPPHQVAGPEFAERLTGHEVTGRQADRAQKIFNLVYGAGWGLIYASMRRRFPQLTRPAALPFGVLYFALCDGLLAPLFKMSPPLQNIPWQPNVKELGNHLAWAATAEMTHRAVSRYGS